MSNRPVHYVDFDKTVSRYDRFQGALHCGDPIPTMAARIRKWAAAGHRIVVHTARLSHPAAKPEEIKARIRDWFWEHFSYVVDVTNIKGTETNEFWDDRAIRVMPNSGETVEEHLAEMMEALVSRAAAGDAYVSRTELLALATYARSLVP